MLFNWLVTSSILPVADRFISLNAGSAHVLNVCEFVEEHHAQILDIWDSGLIVKVGTPWYRRWLTRTSLKPLHISLSVQPGSVPIQTSTWGLLTGRYCTITVEIQPRSIGWSQSEFDRASRKLLWSLRSSFMATQA